MYRATPVSLSVTCGVTIRPVQRLGLRRNALGGTKTDEAALEVDDFAKRLVVARITPSLDIENAVREVRSGETMSFP